MTPRTMRQKVDVVLINNQYYAEVYVEEEVRPNDWWPLMSFRILAASEAHASAIADVIATGHTVARGEPHPEGTAG